jgi:hypothetical protein
MRHESRNDLFKDIYDDDHPSVSFQDAVEAILRRDPSPHKNVDQAANAGIRIALAELSLADDAGVESDIFKRGTFRAQDLVRRRGLGSRKRRRLENDRLIGNPHVVPPEDIDILPLPPFQINRKIMVWTIPERFEKDPFAIYYELQSDKNCQLTRRSARIPRELRVSMRNIETQQNFLRALESPVREFLVEDGDGLTHRDIAPFSEDKNAAARERWLIHCICQYYNAISESVTMGENRVVRIQRNSLQATNCIPWLVEELCAH